MTPTPADSDSAVPCNSVGLAVTRLLYVTDDPAPAAHKFLSRALLAPMVGVTASEATLTLNLNGSPTPICSSPSLAPKAVAASPPSLIENLPSHSRCLTQSVSLQLGRLDVIQK